MHATAVFISFTVPLLMGCTAVDPVEEPLAESAAPQILPRPQPQPRDLAPTVTEDPKDTVAAFLQTKTSDFNPAAAARTANALIQLGETEALRILTAPPPKASSRKQRRRLHYRREHMLVHLCTLLYRSGANPPMRGPRLGGALCPYETMPLSRWPLFPLCISDGTPLLLAQGWFGTGIPESAEAYLKYCKRVGTFRKRLFAVPRREEAIRAVETLIASPRWQKIKWIDSGLGWKYSYSPRAMIDFLLRQARRIRQ